MCLLKTTVFCKLNQQNLTWCHFFELTWRHPQWNEKMFSEFCSNYAGFKISTFKPCGALVFKKAKVTGGSWLIRIYMIIILNKSPRKCPISPALNFCSFEIFLHLNIFTCFFFFLPFRIKLEAHALLCEKNPLLSCKQRERILSCHLRTNASRTGPVCVVEKRNQHFTGRLGENTS